jgi:putative redox protein
VTDSADPSHPSDVTRLELSWASGQHFDVTDASGRTMVLDGDKASGFSPMEALLSSLAGCMGIDVVLILEKMRTGFEGLSMSVEGERVAEPPRHFERIRLRFRIRGDVPRDKAERAVRLSFENYCSVFHTLRRDLDVVSEIVLD